MKNKKMPSKTKFGSERAIRHLGFWGKKKKKIFGPPETPGKHRGVDDFHLKKLMHPIVQCCYCAGSPVGLRAAVGRWCCIVYILYTCTVLLLLCRKSSRFESSSGQVVLGVSLTPGKEGESWTVEEHYEILA